MRDLTQIREELDKIDAEMVTLLLRRLKLSEEVGEYKKAGGKKVYDRAREEEKIRALTSMTEDELSKKCIADIYEHILNYSREVQYIIITENK